MALALACVGIYGIMAYSVAQRTNEIGIRLALGAQPAQVRSMILRESTWLTVSGIVFGVGAAMALTLGAVPETPLKAAFELPLEAVTDAGLRRNTFGTTNGARTFVPGTPPRQR